MQPCLDVRNYCGMLRSNSARSCNKTFLRGIVGRSVTLDNRLWEMELTEQELSLFFLITVAHCLDSEFSCLSLCTTPLTVKCV